MDLYRFYLPDLRTQVSRGEVALPDDQAHHARAVLRLEEGARVDLFDGRGASVHAALTRVAKSGVTAIPSGALAEAPPPSPRLTLATAVPKGDRAEWLIEQASQLNVTAIQWLACDRSVVLPREGGQKLEKWRRLAVESAKQCGRSHLLEIREPAPLAEVLAQRGEDQVLWLDPRAAAGPGQGRAASYLALVGPEGGWSPAESEQLEQACAAGIAAPVRLTPTVLRIETACAAIAAVVMSR